MTPASQVCGVYDVPRKSNAGPPPPPVKAEASQKVPEEAESAAGLGPDLTASVETTYSEQSSSSAGSASSSDQPIYFR